MVCKCDYHTSGPVSGGGIVPYAEVRCRISEIEGTNAKTGSESNHLCPLLFPPILIPPQKRFLPIDKLDLESYAKEKTAPGELALVKFLRMLDHICHKAPGKNLHFEPNADILR